MYQSDYQTMYQSRDLSRPIYPSRWRGYPAPSSRSAGPALGRVDLYDDLGFFPDLSDMEKTALTIGALGLGAWWFFRKKRRRRR